MGKTYHKQLKKTGKAPWRKKEILTKGCMELMDLVPISEISYLEHSLHTIINRNAFFLGMQFIILDHRVCIYSVGDKKEIWWNDQKQTILQYFQKLQQMIREKPERFDALIKNKWSDEEEDWVFGAVIQCLEIKFQLQLNGWFQKNMPLEHIVLKEHSETGWKIAFQIQNNNFTLFQEIYDNQLSDSYLFSDAREDAARKIGELIANQEKQRGKTSYFPHFYFQTVGRFINEELISVATTELVLKELKTTKGFKMIKAFALKGSIPKF